MPFILVLSRRTVFPRPGRLPDRILVQEPAILLAAEAPSWHSKHAPAVHPLTEEERAAQALNRLTFGPRPGDLERIQAIGVKKWVEMQLNPEQVDDSLLEARLQSFPAMRLSQQDLVQAFPSGAVIRAVADGKVALPNDRVERAIYQNQVFAYGREASQARRRKQPSSPGQNRLLRREQIPLPRLSWQRTIRRTPRPRPAKA